MAARTLVGVLVLVGLASCGGSSAEPSHVITVRATEYDFVSDVVPEITAGDTVRFVVENAGRAIHEMQVLDSAGRLIERTERLAPGESEEITVTFADANVYQVICDVDDHLSRGQRALFQVAERSD